MMLEGSGENERTRSGRAVGKLKGLLSSGDRRPFSVEIGLVDAPGKINCEFGDIIHLGVTLRNLGESVLDSRRPGHPD